MAQINHLPSLRFFSGLFDVCTLSDVSSAVLERIGARHRLAFASTIVAVIEAVLNFLERNGSNSLSNGVDEVGDVSCTDFFKKGFSNGSSQTDKLKNG